MRRSMACCALALTTVVAAGCGDSILGPGSAYRLDAVVASLYDCTPGVTTDPGDPAICGSNTDTVRAGPTDSVTGRLVVTAERMELGGVAEPSFSAEGPVDLTRCEASCQLLFRGVVVARMSRRAVVCPGPGPFFTEPCEGRTGDTVYLVSLSLPSPIALPLGGIEGRDGSVEGRFVLGVGVNDPRRFTLASLSLVPD